MQSDRNSSKTGIFNILTTSRLDMYSEEIITLKFRDKYERVGLFRTKMRSLA